MATLAKASRQKISTTISPRSLAYLEALIDKGEADTLADSIDLSLERLFAYQNRERLAADTAAYYDRMSPKEEKEDAELATALARSARGIDVDREP
jgi:hypothetical protein